MTPTREAAFSVGRFNPPHTGDGVEITMPNEQAFVLVFQLRTHSGYDFWQGGKHMPVEAAERGTIGIVNLADAPKAQAVDVVDKLMFHLPRAALDELAENVGAERIDELRLPSGWGTKDLVLERFEPLLIEALQHPEASNSLLTDHILLGLAAHFAHAYGGLRTYRALQQGGLAPWQERRATEMLSANLTKQVSVETIAAECGLSGSHFARAFKVSTGLPPHAWLQKQRIAKAKDLLLRSDNSLAEVALRAGFSDQSHFTRIFSRLVGLTPGNWRRLNGRRIHPGDAIDFGASSDWGDNRHRSA